MKVALITGANGMDARTLTHLLLAKNYKVILTFRRNSLFEEERIKSIFHHNPNLYLQLCDISCQNSVNECIKSTLKNHNYINELYLLAANSHVGDSFKNKELAIQVNGQSTYYFLESLHNFSPSTRTYFAATSELFGGISSGALDESSCFHPRSPYAIGKSLGYNWMQFYKDTYGQFCSCGILFNHSNTERSLDFFIRKVTNAAAKIALGKQSELNLGNLDFSRDEHWSDFGCEMMWAILNRNIPENYVIGTGTTHAGEEYLDLAFGHFNLKWRNHVVLDKSLIRPNEVVRLVADSRKAQKELGWNPNRMSFSRHIDLMCSFDYQLEQGLNPERPKVL